MLSICSCAYSHSFIFFSEMSTQISGTVLHQGISHRTKLMPHPPEAHILIVGRQMMNAYNHVNWYYVICKMQSNIMDTGHIRLGVG